jgi:LPXTG-motif cell wall-anchored protein
MPMRTISAARAFSAAVSLLVLPAAAPAFAADGTYTVPLHQAADLPLTATSAGVEKKSDCPVPAGQDGWHFVLPGKDTDFVKLTVTFDPGGEQVVTHFGPPSDKHAYVASAPGAELVSASAEVKGGSLEWFNLSHTCPAEKSSGSPSPSGSVAPSGSASASPTQPGGVSEGQSGGPSESASASRSASASLPGGAGGTGGGLAETGTQAGGIAGVAALLVAAGSALVLRRRKAAGRR